MRPPFRSRLVPLAAVAAITAAACAAAIGCSITANRIERSTSTPYPTATAFPSNTVTLTMTRSVTNTRTATATATHNPPYIVSIAVDCWNNSGCTVCGATSFICVTGVSNCAFTDPAPGGWQVRRAVVSVHGTHCGTGGSTYTVSLNSFAVGSNFRPYVCACSTCTITSNDSGYVGTGIPGYVYAGTNTLSLNFPLQECLSHTGVDLYCY